MTPATVQDRHLDLLLSMALEQMDRQENERFLRSDDPPIDAGSALRMDQAYAAAYENTDREKRRNQRISFGRKAAHGLRLAFAVLGLTAVLTLAAFPLALAASAEFRGQVMRLFVQFDEREKTGAFMILPEDAPDNGTDAKL